MDSILIEGGKKLEGTVTVSGSKNAALPLFAATLLTKGVHRISNVPDLLDIKTIVEILESLGCKVTDDKKGNYEIDSSDISSWVARYELVKKMRASFLVLGPLLSRLGKAEVSLPGGCAIGERPVDQHLKGLKALGADIFIKDGYVNAKIGKRLTGSEILFDTISVTGVMNIMMAAVTAKGETLIENAAREPEVLALADALKSMGADIEGAGSSRIKIRYSPKLKPMNFRIIPDRIEAGTFMIAAMITAGEIKIENLDPLSLSAVIDKLKEAGADISVREKSLIIKGPKKIESVDMSTGPYPGFPTDMQAQYIALMSVAKATAQIKENIFENRFAHAAELRRMGADITLKNDIAVIKGVKRLLGAEVMATDLRASASLILGGLVAKGTTKVGRIYHLDRGYEKLEQKLLNLGATIKRIKT